jgi:hypothetical protein
MIIELVIWRKRIYGRMARLPEEEKIDEVGEYIVEGRARVPGMRRVGAAAERAKRWGAVRSRSGRVGP